MSFLLYFRYGCGLCDEMKEELDAFIERQDEASQFRYQLIDIDSDQGLKEQFNDLVPLVIKDEQVVLKYFFDEAQLRKVLNI